MGHDFQKHFSDLNITGVEPIEIKIIKPNFPKHFLASRSQRLSM